MIPYAVNLYTDRDLNILSGESLDYAIKFIASFNPQAIGFNCIELNIFERFIEKFPLPYSWGFYFNCGSGDPESNQIQCGVKPSDLAEQIKPLLRLNPLFAGSCCGSNPAHTKAVKELFNEIY
jgi:methionine synthase I (cobalamin-dependent)